MDSELDTDGSGSEGSSVSTTKMTGGGMPDSPASTSGADGPLPEPQTAGSESGSDTGTDDDGGEPNECGIVHRSCDDDGTPLMAVGLNCPSEPHFDMSIRGVSGAATVRSSFGAAGDWSPTEGEAYAVLGTGFVADLGMEAPAGEGTAPTHCSDDVGDEHDLGDELPGPLNPQVSSGDCVEVPEAVGTGDCSGSLEAPFSAGGGVNDYTELRISGVVPSGTWTASFDFAFFSTEYPAFVDSTFNDMFVAWIESESWTGNVALDSEGNAITASSSAIDVRDDNADSPSFEGTCMRGHGGSNWRRVTAPVAEGGEFTLVFAIFDMKDSILDSYVFIDNVEFGCGAVEGPVSEPVR